MDGPEEIVYDEKSDFPAKEVVSPIQQTLFYFTEEEYRESRAKTKPILIFARPCDINAQHIQDKIYAENGGFADSYYVRRRELIHYVLMECPEADDTCFCVSMGTNRTDDYALAVRFPKDGGLLVKVRDEAFLPYCSGASETEFEPVFIEENITKVEIPEIPDKKVLNRLKADPLWKRFDKRCISSGACTIACSTCTCFTTRDLHYGDNPEAGERRRVAASCQVDGFAQVAGGADYRTTPGDRMRYKMLHKFHDYKARFGDRHMCVGCGRCIHRCPEFISVTHTLDLMCEAVRAICAETEEKQ